MIRTLTFMICLLFFSGVAFSQSRTQVKGPKAKNYKSWKNQDTQSQLISRTSEEVLAKGPEAKNNRFSTDLAMETTFLGVSEHPANNLTGPNAKNQRIWNKANMMQTHLRASDEQLDKKPADATIDSE